MSRGRDVDDVRKQVKAKATSGERGERKAESESLCKG